MSILIANFDYETDNELFSGVLEETLRVGLEVAPFVDAFSRKTAANIAASLPGAATHSLDLETAVLIALRQSIDIVVGGTVARDDEGLTVSVTGYSPRDQQAMFVATETALTDADLFSAMALICKELRLRLGDTEKPPGTGSSESFVVANLEAAAEYVIAQDLQLDRKLEDAIVHYEKALEFDPDFARANAGLALTEQCLLGTDAATEHWEAALSRLHTLTERGQLRTLGVYFTTHRRDYEKALETFERLVERYPADNVAQNNLAVAAFYAMNFQRTLEVGRDVAKRFPNHSGYGANVALYAMYASRFDETSDVAQRVIEDDPASAYAFTVMALTHAVRGNFESAEEAYEYMSGLDQFGRSISIEGLADLAMYRGDINAAIAILQSGIEDELSQNSKHTAALKQVMLAEALQQIEEPENAKSAIDQALQNAGGDPAILVPAAITLTRLADAESAEAIAAELSESILKRDRAYASAIRAHVASELGDYAVAIEHASAAIESADLWLIRFIRGNIYLQAGLIAKAEADLQTCQDRSGEAIAVYLNDRPSLRLLRDLEVAMAQANASEQAAALN